MPVIYMQDGKNLFDPQLAYGGVDWGLDEAIVRLAREGEVSGAIVVGVWNTEQRWLEYMPQKALEMSGKPGAQLRFEQEHGGGPISDRYLRFVVEEVKALVDGAYGTLTGREGTFIMGSSMGGLLSLYALCEYPDVFGGAGCLSTHWPAGEGAMVEYLSGALPAPGKHRIYFDYGTETLDAMYEPYQRRVDEIMVNEGYSRGQDWVTRRFEGADHSEQSWRARVDVALEFLLGEPST
jgi:predicted alpha/beta superfamily hydrolase